MRKFFKILTFAIMNVNAIYALPAYKKPAKNSDSVHLTRIAYFPDQEATGVAVSKTGRVFVSLPRLTVDVPISVGEVIDNKIIPFPDKAWNAYRNSSSRTNDPKVQFVSAQAVVMDHHDHLWVVDPAAPGGGNFIPGGVKLVKIDLKANRVIKVYPFEKAATPKGSAINDVRFSPNDDFAYLSDVGGHGSLIVMNLLTGHSWRVLDGDPSTHYDSTVVVSRDGKPVVGHDGQTLKLNVDGITISADGRTFYWQALTGKTVYSIPTSVLRDEQKSKTARPKVAAITHAADGLWTDPAGRFYVTNPGNNSVEVADWVGAPLRVLVQDKDMRWPDSVAQDADGNLYIVASFLGDSPWFNPGATTTPSAIFKISIMH
jgi:sugar lactone lactonase YvrE